MKKTTLALVAAAVMPVTAHAGVINIFEAVGDAPSDITATVDEFRDALGPNNGNAPEAGNRFGRRQINWDAAPDAVSDPNLLPGDFFNADFAPRARGIEFSGVGSTTGFELSATEASGVPPLFGAPDKYQAFSPERVFRPVGGTDFDITFYTPADNTQRGTVRGMGIVFTGVVPEDDAELAFYDADDNLLFARSIIAGGDRSLSFLDVIFDSFQVSRVRVSSVGGAPIVMDDFIFGEPVDVSAVPIPAAAALFPLGAMALARRRRKAKA
ncbi:MAG: hypothetical protein AAF830_03570 [Pseudomonadota bacterium]